MLASLFSVPARNLLDVGFNHILLAMGIVPLFVLTFHAIYNRYFHPLNKFPGPFWASVTDVYNTCLFSTRQQHVELLLLHQKYGSVIRLSPNLLSFADPALLPQIYHRHANKTPFYSTGMAGEEPPLLQVQADADHATKLKVIGSSYSMAHMRQSEKIVDERISKTCEVLKSRFASTSMALDLAVYIRWHVYDTMSHLIYGKSVGMVEKGCDVDGLISEWHRVFTLGGLIATLPWLINPIITSPLLKRFLMPSKQHGTGSGHIMLRHEKMFKYRMSNPHLAREGNLVDSFLRTKHADGTRMSLEEVEHECFILTVGSQDTSAAFMSALVNYVLQDPAIQTRLLAEIALFEQRGHLSFPVVRYDETVNMPYFMACVHETLRLSPSVSMILPRYAPSGGIVIDGTWVPETTEIAANPFVIHRNTAVFGSDAGNFRPERWLGDSEQIRYMYKHFFAFGYGSRRCLGKNIALFESQKFCLQLFRDFHLRRHSAERPFRVENWGINVYFEQYIEMQTRISD